MSRRNHAVAVLAALSFACAPGGDGVEEGLGFESASPEQGLSGTFTLEGRTIRFDALRGEPDEGDALTPVDARFAGVAGDSFLVQAGGHGLVRPEWDLADARDAEGRRADFELVLAAATALADADLPEALALERDALVALGRTMQDTPLDVTAEGFHPSAAIYCDPGYRHTASVRHQRVSFAAAVCLAAGIPDAQHSAVRMCSYRVSTTCGESLVGCKSSCNHGTCWSSMVTTSCSYKSGWRSNTYPPFQNTASGTGACTTAYGFCSGTHVCNDDSLVQLNNVRYNTSYSSTGGTCGDSTLRLYAPAC